jgi:hypothetical protein
VGRLFDKEILVLYFLLFFVMLAAGALRKLANRTIEQIKD